MNTNASQCNCKMGKAMPEMKLAAQLQAAPNAIAADRGSLSNSSAYEMMSVCKSLYYLAIRYNRVNT